jgi:N-acetylneuraminic acid mutarotase
MSLLRRVPFLRVLALGLTWLAVASAPSAFQAPSATSGGAAVQGAPKRRTLPQIELAPKSLDFGPLTLGQVSPTLVIEVQNVSSDDVTLTAVQGSGSGAADFSVLGPALPLVLPAAGTASLQVSFQPTVKGLRQAQVTVAYTAGSEQRTALANLVGMGLGVAGEEINVNVGGFTHVDTLGVTWSSDFGFSGGGSAVNPSSISGTLEADLYKTHRKGLAFSYALPLPSGGYAVTLHFAEPKFALPLQRVFDVSAEGALLIDDLDLAAVAGLNTAYATTHTVIVSDGVLDLSFTGGSQPALLSAIEVSSAPILAPDASLIDFGGVTSGQSHTLPLVLSNPGTAALSLSELEILQGTSGTAESFSVDLGGGVYAGMDLDVSYPLGLAIPAGGSVAGSVTFAPEAEQLDLAILVFHSNAGTVSVELSGLGGHVGHPFLHTVIAPPALSVDYDEDGSENVILDGSQSHTHYPGGSLVGFTWEEGGELLSSAPVAVVAFDVGAHDVDFTITDDTVPPEFLEDHVQVRVYPKTAVPGALATYYQATGSAGALLGAVPETADFAEPIPVLYVDGGTHVGSSTLSQNVLAVMEAKVSLPSDAYYRFRAFGGAQRMVLVNNLVVIGPVFLTAGDYDLEARFALGSAAEQPLTVELSIDGAPFTAIDAAWVVHDETDLKPVISTMPSIGTSLGGNQIAIEGVGFFPFDEVEVHWGAATLSGAALTSVSATEIRLVSPAGSGEIDVTVETPAGLSNVRKYVYDQAGPVPIQFALASEASAFSPTTGDWGPDGRFYVGSTDGKIRAIEYGDAYNIVSVTEYHGLNSLQAKAIMGLAFDPSAPPGVLRLYVSSTEIFAMGGSSFTGPAPYESLISRLDGPAFNSPVSVVTGLPTSNHDHGVNGMYFDHNGDLVVAVGGNTNAGIKWPSSGDLPESPLSGALLKARLSLGLAFQGNLTYADTLTGLVNNDQVFGESVDALPADVFVFAPGFRNPYDVVLTTSGLIYATDNGPNSGFGPASTGATTFDPTQPQFPDELALVRPGVFYGHPNRGRGRYFPEENVYMNPLVPDQPGVFRQTLTSLPSSTDGIAEYRSRTFQSQMRGDLLVSKFGGDTRRVRLSDDGLSVLGVDVITPFTGGLDVATGPGGAILAMDHNSNKVRAFVPNDLSAVGLIAHDITPWRAPASGGARFVIGGVGFGTLANTTVEFGALPAVLQSVSATRIVGFVPANPAPTAELQDVTVRVSGLPSVITDAFRYLCAPGCELGAWEPKAALPQALGRTAAGAIGGKLYVVGEGSSATAIYNLETGSWLANGAARPFPGSDHAAEVFGGKLYLLGGLGAGSEGNVQIYDPALNTWSLGAPMPWAGGAVASAKIQGKLYAAGGIVGGATVASVAAYDPALNTWSSCASMPAGRNRAAAATDGRFLYVFGGATGGGALSNGSNDVQIYAPLTNSWKWDKDGVSGLAPLPVARSGMGKAVAFQGELFVFGGETLSGAGAVAGNVYDRVDVYDPVHKSWRLETAMPNPRHGSYPVLYEGKIYLAGGAAAAGPGSSATFDVFIRR